MASREMYPHKDPVFIEKNHPPGPSEAVQAVYASVRIGEVPSEVRRVYDVLGKMDHTGVLPEIKFMGSFGLNPDSSLWSRAKRFFARHLSMIISLVWLVCGIYSAVISDVKPVPLWISTGILTCILLFFLWSHWKHNWCVFYLYSDSMENIRPTMQAYLGRITASASISKLRRICERCFPQPEMKVFLRSAERYDQFDKGTKLKIMQVLSAAVCVVRISDAYNKKDELWMAQLVFHQKLKEVTAALCSLWAVAWGFHKTFGSLASWAMFILTVFWFWRRLAVLLQSLRIWAFALPNLHTQPLLASIRVIYPQEVYVWQNKDQAVAWAHAAISGWGFHATIAVYIVLFGLLLNWNDAGSLWKEAVKVTGVFIVVG